MARRVVLVVFLVLLVLALIAYDVMVGTQSGPSYTPTTTSWSTTTTLTQIERVGSLDGTIHSMRGEEITEYLWNNMVEVSPEEYRAYLEWLVKAASEDPAQVAGALVPGGQYVNVHTPGGVAFTEQGGIFGYNYLNSSIWLDVKGFRPGANPLAADVVRMGVVELPFGAGLIVTAWQGDDGKIDVIIHATVLDKEEYKEAIARAGTILPSCRSGIYGYSLNFFGSPVWTLWRFTVPGEGSYLETPDGQYIPIDSIVVLVEMPTYGGVAKDTLLDRIWYGTPAYYYEYLGWTLIGTPALGLAYNLAYPEGMTSERAYKMNTYLGSDIATYGAGTPPYAPFDEQPATLRVFGGGVCHDWSHAVALAASSIGFYVRQVSHGDHATVALVGGSGYLVVDTDKDGVRESVVIADTANLPREKYERTIYSYLETPPFLYVPHYGGGSTAEQKDQVVYTVDGELAERNDAPPSYHPIYAGFVDAVLGLPGWLQPPWLEYALEISNYEEYVERAWSPDAWLAYGIGTGKMTDVSVRALDEYACLVARYNATAGIAYGLEDPYLVPPSERIAGLPSVVVADYSGVPGFRWEPLVATGEFVFLGNESNESVDVYVGRAVFPDGTVIVVRMVGVDGVYGIPYAYVYYEAYIGGELVYARNISKPTSPNVSGLVKPTWIARQASMTPDITALPVPVDDRLYVIRLPDRVSGQASNARVIQLEPAYRDESGLPVFQGYVWEGGLANWDARVLLVPDYTSLYTGQPPVGTVRVWLDGQEYRERVRLDQAPITVRVGGLELALAIPEPPPPAPMNVYATIGGWEPYCTGSGCGWAGRVQGNGSGDGIVVLVDGLYVDNMLRVEITIYGVPPLPEPRVGVQGYLENGMGTPVNATTRLWYDGALHVGVEARLEPGVLLEATIAPYGVYVYVEPGEPPQEPPPQVEPVVIELEAVFDDVDYRFYYLEGAAQVGGHQVRAVAYWLGDGWRIILIRDGVKVREEMAPQLPYNTSLDGTPITLLPPEPPRLDAALSLHDTPVDLGGVLVDVYYEYPSEGLVRVWIWVAGVPPWNYTVTLEPEPLDQTVAYNQALIITATLDWGREYTVTIQPLNLTITIPPLQP